jgi:drug/metabolite transporter (DMT)-like permease
VVPVVLFAALLHATWNAMAHAVPDRLIGFALIGTAYLVAGGAMAAAAPLPAAGSWVYLVGSVLLHVLYNLLLMRSFMLGDFGQVYPLARGTAVAVVAVLATVAVGEAMPPVRLVGVILVCLGLVALVAPLGRTARAEVPAVVSALGTGVMIAGYTTVDGVGVRGSGSVLGYTGWLFLLQGAALPILAFARRGRGLPRQARPYLLAGLAGGVLSLAAYGLVLWAQTRAPLAPVAALRETSSLMGAIIGAVVFKESFGRRRVVAAVVVTIGVVLTNL